MSDTMFEKFPAIENTEELNKERNIYEKELKSFENKQTNIINTIADYKHDDTGSSITALKTKLKDLDERIADLKFKIQTVENHLLIIPTKQEISDRLEQFEKELIEAHNMSYARGGNIFHDLPFIEKQKLIKLIFGGQDDLGKRYGIYVKFIGGEHKKYEFTAYGRIGNIRGLIEGEESYSYSDDDIYTSDYPEEIKKDVRKIVSVVDNNKERMAERQIEGISDNNNERIHSLKNKERMLCLPNSYNISIGNNQKIAEF